jgi:hypothetical protein
LSPGREREVERDERGGKLIKKRLRERGEEEVEGEVDERG